MLATNGSFPHPEFFSNNLQVLDPRSQPLRKFAGRRLFPQSSSVGGMAWWYASRSWRFSRRRIAAFGLMEHGIWTSRIIPSVSVSHVHASSWPSAGWWYNVVVWVYWMWRSIRRIIACFGGRTIGENPEFSLPLVSASSVSPPSQVFSCCAL